MVNKKNAQGIKRTERRSTAKYNKKNSRAVAGRADHAKRVTFNVPVTRNKKVAKADQPNHIDENPGRVRKAHKAVKATTPAAQKGTRRVQQSHKAVTRSHVTSSQRTVAHEATTKTKIPTKQEISCKINKTRPSQQELDDWHATKKDPKLNISYVRKFWYNDIVYLTPKIARSLMGKKIYVMTIGLVTDMTAVEEYTKANKIAQVHRFTIIKEVFHGDAAQFSVNMDDDSCFDIYESRKILCIGRSGMLPIHMFTST